MKWRYLNVLGHSPQRTEARTDGPLRSKNKSAYPAQYKTATKCDIISYPLLTGNHESTTMFPIDGGAMQADVNPSPCVLAPTTTIESNTNSLDESPFLNFWNDSELTPMWDSDWDVTNSSLNNSGLDSGIFLSPIQMPLDEKSLILSNHYFSDVCPINSCFDSHRNPLRSFVGNLMTSSLIYTIVITVSASHICHRDKEMVSLALRHRSNAMSHLAKWRALEKETFEVLLANILLEMTSSWQDAASLGLAHLFGARTLSKQWSTKPCNNVLPHSISFMVGLMAYWEAMTSFLTADGPEALQYLTAFCDQEHRDDIVYPNPWTGISTTLFIYTALAGALCRQTRVLRALSVSTTSPTVLDEIYSQQVCEAIELERQILKYTPPNPDRIEDPGDGLTAIHHFECLAQIYRFTALLLLYMSFPGLQQSKYQADSPHKAKSFRQLA